MTEPQDDRAIARYVLDTFALWGNANAYAARFTSDSDYVAFDGSRHRGRDANVALHRPLFEGVLYGTRIIGEIESVRWVGSDVAVVHASGAVVWPWHRDVPSARRSRQTLLVVRQSEGLSIAAFHNTRVEPVRIPPRWLARAFRFWVRLRSRLANAPVSATIRE
ncbi:MAG: SgcJ/EcaC family oxidoreductase [Polyangiaceae bacterium]|nr:SgcJ/EcaC family oxidoreductase [Polyangiaceae bacterium]